MVGQAGKPKTITGFQTHTTPVLLAYGERAELATEECILSTILMLLTAKFFFAAVKSIMKIINIQREVKFYFVVSLEASPRGFTKSLKVLELMFFGPNK